MGSWRGRFRLGQRSKFCLFGGNLAGTPIASGFRPPRRRSAVLQAGVRDNGREGVILRARRCPRPASKSLR
jgi:hypothetical protein